MFYSENQQNANGSPTDFVWDIENCVKAKMVEISMEKFSCYNIICVVCVVWFTDKKGSNNAASCLLCFFMRNLYKIYRKHRLLMINC